MSKAFIPAIAALLRRAVKNLCAVVFMTAIGCDPLWAETPRVDCDPAQDRIRLPSYSGRLFELLSAVSGECGIVFKADPSLDRELQLAFESQQLEPALKSVMHGISYLFIYAQERTSAGSRRIMEVHLLPQGMAGIPLQELPATPRQTIRDAYRPPRPEKVKERARSPREEEHLRNKKAAREASARSYPGLAGH